jgi:hypothetical protein
MHHPIECAGACHTNSVCVLLTAVHVLLQAADGRSLALCLETGPWSVLLSGPWAVVFAALRAAALRQTLMVAVQCAVELLCHLQLSRPSLGLLCCWGVISVPLMAHSCKHGQHFSSGGRFQGLFVCRGSAVVAELFQC